MTIRARLARTTGLLALTALAGLGTGCSLDGGQCSTDGDCVGLGGGTTQLVCSSSRTCVVAGSANAVFQSSTGATCETNDNCVSLNGGRPAVCRQGAEGKLCQDVANDACSIVEGDWQDPNALFLGTITQARTNDPSGAFYGKTVEWAVDMGLEEVNNSAGGLPGANASRRPLVAVHCSLEALNSSEQIRNDATAEVQHLQALGAKALFVTDELTLNPSISAAVQANLFTMCSYCPTNPGPGTNGIVFRAQTPWSTMGHFFDWSVDDFESKVRANPDYGIGSSGSVKVALMTTKGPYTADIADIVAQDLTFNGASALTQPNNFLRVANDAWTSPTCTSTAYAAAQQVLALRPQIVVLASDVDAQRIIIPIVESGWGSGPRPYYVMGLAGLTKETLEVIGLSEDLRRRIFGVSAWTDLADPAVANNANGFVARLSAFLGGGQVTLDNSITIQPYDAFYSTFYAMAASNVPDPTATDIRLGFSKLTNGLKVNVGPTGVSGALGALSQAGSIDLEGSMTHLDWNSQQGHLVGPLAGYCAVRDDSGNPIWTSDSGVHSATGSTTVTGSILCY